MHSCIRIDYVSSFVCFFNGDISLKNQHQAGMINDRDDHGDIDELSRFLQPNFPFFVIVVFI